MAIIKKDSLNLSSKDNIRSMNGRTKPFLKWAGGKRWFVANYSHILPKKFNRYIEPFLGSGAVFFYLQPKRAILGDINPDLINTYQAIKENWKLVYRYLREHHNNHCHKYYYKVRESKPRSMESRAARFVYLNRTCWNGLYRVNLKGIFNVPIGTKSSVIFEDDNFEKVSKLLSRTKLYAHDFEKLIDRANKDDLVFVDPPYTVRHNHNAFIKYNEKLFSWDDQSRLYFALKRAKNRGARIVGTNAFHQCIRDLYDEAFDSVEVTRNSPISSKASTRKNFEELVIFTESSNE